MEWYYSLDGEKIGPLDNDEFLSLVGAGTISNDTLVWNTNMTDWKPFEEAPKPQANIPAVGSTFCSECGNAFSEEDLVRFENVFVCASCKPVLIQKIKEGVTVSGMEYGGFWVRFGAKIIDWLILLLPNMAIGYGVGALQLSATNNTTLFVIFSLLGFIVQLIVPATYATWFIGKYAATPGKMACGLKVVTAENEKVSYMRAFGRHFAEMLSSLILMIGYLMAAIDPEKRTLHDRMCNTRVIRK